MQLIRQAQDQEEVELYVRNAETGVRRLCRTLNQMMTLAHAEAAVDPQDQCTSVHACVQNVLERLSPMQQARVELTLQGTDQACHTPRSMVETEVRNLIDNALKYSPQEHLVQVLVQTDEGRNGCSIQVCDRGEGMSAVQTAHLGRRFWRGDQARQHKDGAGLGISIVTAIAIRFEGSLQYRERQGGGLVAELLLP